MKKLSIIAITLLAVLAFTIYSIFLKPHNRKYKIAVLNYSPAAECALKGLRKGLEKQGYIEGGNLTIIYHGCISDKKQLPKEAAELAALNPDLIYSISTPATLAAKEVGIKTGIPIVFGPVNSPLESGIVTSLKHPDENITGVTFGPQEPRRLEMLTRFVPEIKRILVPYNPNDKSPVISLKKIQLVAETLGLEIIPIVLTYEGNFSKQLTNAPLDIDAVFSPTDSMQVSYAKAIANFAIQRKLPYTCPQKEGVKAGALFSYGFSLENVGVQASRIVHMILSGTPAVEIPVELSEFTLSINIATAEQIGLTIPDYLSSNAFIIRQ
ncbi:protein of unknown function DUF534 [Denitrovibrio acetiphilus DSM 12809]|uniref:ABC transporter substrate binding protein n=1 Tax=Denitrovibrio acetiphilus (strain DSM 12809 / NBRC 114555 / N2460) TaxID=522772 RepID=D4H637_DENA2|nr:ABC transporter substrate-binding protein [Denitrovibrio acetiphilus]ADD67683.1 protein of unknown function DUF534 [Denitrovibrio acetiphilus DSM 12809]